MLSREVVVMLGGTPAGKGSMRCVGRNGRHQLIADNSKPQKLWHDAIVYAIRQYDGAFADKHQSLGVEVTFTLRRPKSHYGSGRNASKLNARAPEHPTARGTYDVDKLARLLLDALQDAQIIVDDAQVIELNARKTYELSGAPDSLGYGGALIRIYPIEW